MSGRPPRVPGRLVRAAGRPPVLTRTPRAPSAAHASPAGYPVFRAPGSAGSMLHRAGNSRLDVPSSRFAGRRTVVAAGPKVRMLTPGDIRELAGRLGVRPSKRLGQNFVVEAGTVRRI